MPLNPHKLGRDGVAALIVFALLTLLSTLAVIARFVARKMRAGIGWDDWTSLAALITSYGWMIASVIALKNGHAGYHITQYSDQELEVLYKADLAGTWMYTFAIALPKISALIMYARIFPVRSLQIWKWAMGGIVIGYVIAGLVTNMLELSPLQAQWKPWIPHLAKIQEKPFDIIMSIINIALDVVILAIPQARVWKLKMTARRKFMMSLVFLLGGFVCISSIIRTISLETLNTSDVPYTILDSIIWSTVEINTSIVCTCLPLLPVLVNYMIGTTSWDGSPRSHRSSSRSRLFTLHRTRGSKTKASTYTDFEDGRSLPVATKDLDLNPVDYLAGHTGYTFHIVQPTRIGEQADSTTLPRLEEPSGR